MDAKREFKKYDQKNNQVCDGTEFSSKVMRFKEIDIPICVQMREDKRKTTVKENGTPTYFTRILFKTKFGTWRQEDYSRYKFSTPKAAMDYLTNAIHLRRDEINRVYRKGM